MVRKPRLLVAALASLALAGCGEQSAVGDSPEAANGVGLKDSAPSGKVRGGPARTTSGKGDDGSAKGR